MVVQKIFMALIGILLGTAVATAEAQTLLRIAYPAFPPFHWVREDGAMTGLFYDILTEALEKRMAVKMIWTAYPWIRCQESLKTGADDALITVPTAERAVYTVTHRDAFYRKPLHLFTYADHPRWNRIKAIRSLTDLRDGGFSVITYSGNGWHKENLQPLGIKTYETGHLINVWKMLAARRGDAVIEWPPGAWPEIRQAGETDRIVDTAVALSTMPFHLLIRKDHPRRDLLAAFNETVHRMRVDGVMERILSRYGAQ